MRVQLLEYVGNVDVDTLDRLIGGLAATPSVSLATQRYPDLIGIGGGHR